MFRTVPLSIIRSFSLYPQQWHMSYSFLTACAGSGCSSLILLASCQETVWHMPLLCVQWKTPDDGQRSFIPRISLRNQCIWLVYYKNLSWCTVTGTSKFLSLLKVQLTISVRWSVCHSQLFNRLRLLKIRHITQCEKCITIKESTGANTWVAVNNIRTICVFASEMKCNKH